MSMIASDDRAAAPHHHPVHHTEEYCNRLLNISSSSQLKLCSYLTLDPFIAGNSSPLVSQSIQNEHDTSDLDDA
jgi:hypothetical protein